MLEIGQMYTHCSDLPKNCKWVVKDFSNLTEMVVIHPKFDVEAVREVPVEFFEKWYNLCS